jgi:hypothetical protein
MLYILERFILCLAGQGMPLNAPTLPFEVYRPTLSS